MSGLFAKLVDAALGRGEVLCPPPRARFALENSFEPQNEWPQLEAQEASESKKRTQHGASETPVRRAQPSVSMPAHEAPPELGTRADGPPLIPPKAPDEVRSEALAPRRAALSLTADDAAPQADAAQRSVIAEASSSSAPIRPTVGDDRPLLEPSLLPRPAESDVSRRAPASPKPLRSDAAAVSPTAVLYPEIRIGRIEVIPPAATAVTKAGPRALRPARTAPRQSLDDYLRVRRD